MTDKVLVNKKIGFFRVQLGQHLVHRVTADPGSLSFLIYSGTPEKLVIMKYELYTEKLSGNPVLQLNLFQDGTKT